MKLVRAACVALTMVLVFGSAGGAPTATSVTDADVYAELGPAGAVLGNDYVERRWDPAAFVTTSIRDKRPGGFAASTPQPDFALLLDGIRVASDLMQITGTRATVLPRGGIAVTFTLSIAGLVEITRVVEAYPRVAGFAARTTVEPLVPLVVSGYTLDEVAIGSDAAPTVHAFRGGSDWREPSWQPQGIGDPHTGDWHVSASAGKGKPLTAAGEWLSLAQTSGRTAFMVMERMNYSSSRMSYDGEIASALVDLSRDVIYAGPFEESIHVENPGPGPARHRVLLPATQTSLERVFTGFGATADDEPWQFYKYLSGHRLTPYPKTVMFNTDGVDANVISTGAKDDVDFTRFVPLAEAAREMGVETFILDDGWQARSGDWCPDSEACPEPRPRFPHRFPDDEFGAVREVLAGAPGAADDMRLGLWMTPMAFHPSSTAFTTNPQWACLPVGLGTAALSIVQPDDGSNEPGIGLWNPEAIGRDPDTGSVVKLIDYIEGRIRRAIKSYGARYFKFDFLVWVDCLGVAPVDAYAYHDSFVAMLDRVQMEYPEVTLQIDDTNDYRLFPFETIARGPAWFQNGAPETPQLLHNLWNLAPYVPGFAIGQKSLTNTADVAARGIDYSMAVALGSHMTFMTEIDKRYDAVQRARVKRWTDFYKANREVLATFTYPLLADPLDKGWTALQPWNADAGRGFLLAFRQEATNPTQRIGLHGVPATGSFTLTLEDPATGSSTALGVVPAETLRSGFDVTIPSVYGYALIRVEPS